MVKTNQHDKVRGADLEQRISSSQPTSARPKRASSFVAQALALLTGLSPVVDAYDAEAHHRRPKELVGTGASFKEQVTMFRTDNLSALRDKAHIRQFMDRGYLVQLPRHTQSTPDANYYVHNIPQGYAATRPQVLLFLERLAQQYNDKFDDKLRVTSATRSIAYQRKLSGYNGNAARPAYSSHVRGAAIDISYRFMDAGQKKWMRDVLSHLDRVGAIEATEEIFQPVFHVMVYKKYFDYVQRITGKNDRQMDGYVRQMTGGSR